MKRIISVVLSGFTAFAIMYGNFHGVSALDSLSETIEFYDGKADVEINEEMFGQNSNGYHKNIAMLASSLSSASYNGDKENGYYINRAYESLGFNIENNVTLFSYEGAENNASYDTDLIDIYGDSLSFSVATREIGDTRLLVIALRGTNLNSTSDILSDISIFGTDFYKDSSPTGFVNFFRKVSVGLSLYLEEHPEITDSADKGKLKILITGHSLGGAGTNLLGAYFNTHEDNNYSGFDGNEAVNIMFSEKLDIPQSDIFVYSFACPNVYYGDPTVTDCDNIINIVNESDLIPQVPSGQKFGQFVYFDTNEDNGLSAHYGHKYVNATDKDIPDGVRYYSGAVDTVLTEDMFYQDSDEYHSNIAEIAVALSSASYNGRRSFRDMNGTEKMSDESENIIVPEQIPVSNTGSINMTQRNNSMYSQQMNFPQNQSVHYQQANFPKSQSVYQRQNNIPSVTEKPQDKFLYYTNNSNSNNNIPVPPPLPKPDPPQPPKPEIPTPTPPPKMVKANQPTVRKADRFSSDFGAFGGTFDTEPDQSTPIADIPVMNNIDDYKL